MRFGLVLLGCFGTFLACGDQPLHLIRPQIAVDVCKTGGVEDCAIDVGSVDLSEQQEQILTIWNPSASRLELRRIALGHKNTSFEVVVPANLVLLPGARITVPVRFRPQNDAGQQEDLIIESDATNMPSSGGILVKLRGVGINNGVPKIDLKGNCNFGNVPLGTSKFCQVEVGNGGNRSLIVKGVSANSVAFSSSLSDSDQKNILVAPNTAKMIQVEFRPTHAAEFRGTLEVVTNDLYDPVKQVPLTGWGVTAPEARCSIYSVNGRIYTPTSKIKPLDRVILSAAGSHFTDKRARKLVYHWEIIGQPKGSHARLSTPLDIKTGFEFADGVLGVDLAGKYKARLTVQDDLGSFSQNCELELDAVPQNAIHVQLVWDENYGDMDLHLAKKDLRGRFCTTPVSRASELGDFDSQSPRTTLCSDPVYEECNFLTCRPHTEKRPDWDGDGYAGAARDPSLDIDDLSGFGPENINIDEALPGSYLVRVHFYSNLGQIKNTVRLYLFGQLVGEYSNTLAPKDWWEVAIIHIPRRGAPCVEDLGNPSLQCPGML